MSQSTDRKGRVLKVGHRVLIPARIVELGPAHASYNTKVLLDEPLNNKRSEYMLNSSQIDLHPDETPADPQETPVPKAGGVQDSNVGTIVNRVPPSTAPKSEPDKPAEQAETPPAGEPAEQSS